MHYKTKYAVVISNSNFTDAALKLASSTDVYLISKDFIEMFNPE